MYPEMLVSGYIHVCSRGGFYSPLNRSLTVSEDNP